MALGLECRRCEFPAPSLDDTGLCSFCATLPAVVPYIPQQEPEVDEQEPEVDPETVYAEESASSTKAVVFRDYQLECMDRTFEQLEIYNSTLIVKATGTGKTIMFAGIIDRWTSGRVIVMAHRDELIQQACKKIKLVTGERCDVEMGESRADSSIMYTKSKCVVTSVQTMGRANRMKRFNPNDFGLLVIDEAHHAAASSYLAVIEYFRQNPALKVIGVTATPDRADEKALGQIFESVAFEYGILDGISDGWIVPIDQKLVYIAGLDLSRCRTSDGDLSKADLSRIMEEEERCHEITSAVLQNAHGQTLIFTVSVKQAEMISDILNRHEAGCSRWVCGEARTCPMDVRRDILGSFARNEFQYLVNCSVLLEGYDEPNISTVAMARPTKSRSLYTQIIGRGTRPLDGTVDGISTADGRKAAIAASEKPSILILDFVGNSGKHKLICTADILGGDYEDAVVAKAIEAVKSASSRNERLDMLKALRDAEQALKEVERKRREGIKADARTRLKSVDPFDVFDIAAKREPEYQKGLPLSKWHTNVLKAAKIEIGRMTYTAADQLCNEITRRWKNKLCTFPQAKCLRRAGFTTADSMTFQEAGEWITKLKASNWKMPIPEGM